METFLNKHNSIMEDKLTFFMSQLKNHLTRNNIPHMIFQNVDNPDDILCHFTNRIYINILGTALGHSDVNIYTNKNKELVAVSLNEVTSALLGITNILGQLYGVDYKEVKLLNPIYNKYIFYF